MLQSVTAPAFDQSIDRGIQVLQIVILSVFAINIIASDGHIRKLAWAYAAAAALSYLVSLFDLGLVVVDASVVQQQNLGARATGTVGNANQFGTLMVQGQLAAVFAGIYARHYPERIAAAFVYTILAVGAINSGSRTALVGMLLLAIGLIWVFKVWKFRRLSQSLVLLACIALIGGGTVTIFGSNEHVTDTAQKFLSSEWVATRYKNLLVLITSGGDLEATNETGERSLDDRAALAAQAWKDSLHNAPFGLGLNNYSSIYGSYAHSNYFEILADTGFLGLLLFLGIYGHMAYRAISLSKRRSRSTPVLRLYALSVFILAVMDISRVTYYNKQYWFYVFLIVGVIETYRRTQAADNRALMRNEDKTPVAQSEMEPVLRRETAARSKEFAARRNPLKSGLPE